MLVGFTIAFLIAAIFGWLMGLSIGYLQTGGDLLKHPYVAAFVKRRNGFKGFVVAIYAWAFVIYLVPKLALYITGEERSIEIFMLVQFLIVMLLLMIGVRAWEWIK